MKYPKFLKFTEKNVLVKINIDNEVPAIYYRHGGDYKVEVTLIDGKFFSGKHFADSISNTEMFVSTLDEWDKSNGQYASPKYIQVQSTKMKRTNWNTYLDKTGRIKAMVQYKNGAWEIFKCHLYLFVGYKIEPITEELFLK